MSTTNTRNTRSGDFSHVDDDVRPYLSMSSGERLKRIKSDKWIGYRKAEELTDEMEALVAMPDSIRNPGLLITAPPNNGKSWLVHQFARKYPAKEREDGTGICVPVVLINSPHKPDTNWFLSKILSALNAPHKTSDKSQTLFDQVVGMCSRLGVRLLIADEISDAVDGTAVQQRNFLNMIKSLNNELRRPIVLTGTERIEIAMAIDEQVQRRFPPRRLPEWEADIDYMNFLAAFEETLPLKLPSQLIADQNRMLAFNILEKGKNRTGYIVELLRKAAEKAIISGEERITLEIIENVKL